MGARWWAGPEWVGLECGRGQIVGGASEKGTLWDGH